MTEVEEILYKSIKDEIDDYLIEDFNEVMNVISMIHSSGVYMYYTNQSFEFYAGLMANNLVMRKFILGVSERFHINLSISNSYYHSNPGKHVDGFFSMHVDLLNSMLENIQDKSSVITDSIKAGLALEERSSVLAYNRPYVVMHLALSTGVLIKALRTVEEEIAYDPTQEASQQTNLT